MHTQKLLRKVTFLFWSILLISCSKGKIVNPSIPSIPAATADPTQYGIPFTEVPDASNATVYQVNMRAFSAQGNFKGVLSRLDSIKSLGVNVVYLMPIYPIGKLKAFDSPYAVQDYMAVNPELGTLADLRALVDGAHARRMAVVLDWVANHTAWDHPWITAHKDWYQQDASGNIKNPPLGWTDVAQLNFANASMRAAMIQAMRYWVFQANIDGYRLDYADGPPYEFLTEAVSNLNSISTHKLLLIAEGSDKTYYFQAGFQLRYGFDFLATMKDQIFAKRASVKLLDNLNVVNYQNAPAGARMLRYTSNHDINSSEGTPLELFDGQQGSMAAFVVAAYMKGTPMIYNGQEVGFPARLPFMGARRTIDWSLNPAVTKEYKKILRFRNSSDAVRNGALTSYSSDDVCAFTKIAGNEQVLVLANLRNAPITYEVPASFVSTTWQNALGGQPLALSRQLALQPYQYFILQK
jgi:glycosidase